MNHILLFEPNQERVPQLMFLLKLADIRCTLARTIEEALNWLSADRLQVINFDLFLLGSLQGVELDKQLQAEILSSVTVPVIYAQWEDLSLPESLNDAIIVCPPDNLLSCLQEYLVPEKNNREWRRCND